MKPVTALICAASALSLGGCYVLGNDEGERYLQRKDVVTLSAGDAKEVNARTHMDAAWPPGVGDRRIIAHGDRMVVRAIEPYRTLPKQTSSTTINIGTNAGANLGGSPGAR